MIFRILQFSDIHVDEENTAIYNPTSVAAALSVLPEADSYVVVSSGDIAYSGQKSQYDIFSKFITWFLKQENLPRKNRHIDFAYVPGNHDIDYGTGYVPRDPDEFKEKYGRSIRSDKIDNFSSIKDDYHKAQEEFFICARRAKCEWENRSVLKKTVDVGDLQFGFVMVNSAPFSLMKGDNIDKGCHQLSDDDFACIEEATDSKYNILILHHGLEWFTDTVKKKLRTIIADKYIMVLTGHEHDEMAENRVINNSEPCLYVQANAFNDQSVPENGFCTIDINTETREISVCSFVRHNDIYVHDEVCNTLLQKFSVNGIRNDPEYIDYLNLDQSGAKYDGYYFFPTLEYHRFDENNRPVKHVFRTEADLYEFILGKGRVSISGDQKYGKTLLAKRMYLHMIEHGFVTILFDTEIHNMKKERIVESFFKRQYLETNDSYERFLQLPVEKKIAIIDDADLIKPRSFNELIEILSGTFGTIVILHKSELQTDIHKQVLEAIDDELRLSINPFWYSSRKGLISNLLTVNNVPEEKIVSETQRINDLINRQIKYFNLNPEFIIDFVKLYEQDVKFQFTAGKEAFSMVYENAIKTRIIANCQIGSPERVFNVLQEIAYYMHFSRKKHITMTELCACIDKYKEDYRQDVSYVSFIDTVKKSGIFTESDNKFSFKDRTHLAYFVARAINMKASDPSDPEYAEAEVNFKDILDNLCFGINSDIVLFISVITSSPRFVGIIIQKAEEFFSGKEELNFAENNISFVENTSVQIKESLPNKDDKRRREEQISESERHAKLTDVIETVDEYDYSEEDLQSFANQIQKGFKYLEILSKTLPAFCSSMRRGLQDKLVDLIYRCPNKFLYMMLKDINDNFDEFIDVVYEEVSQKEKDREIKKEEIRIFTEQISAMLITSIYNLIAATNASSETIGALNAFEGKTQNSNYEILNLMFNARGCDTKTLCDSAISLDRKYTKPIERSIIKFAVRDYYLRNDVELHGDGAALADHFFGPGSIKQLQIEMGRKKLSGPKE